ncbi:MAG TPA: hypothetical protein VGE46_06150, partial [Bdellovibrio sp.]
MSLKISFALISAALLFSNAACTQKRDVMQGLSKEDSPAPKIPVNIDKAAGFAKKDAAGTATRPATVEEKPASSSAATAPAATSAPTAAAKKEPFPWKIPIITARSGTKINLAGRNSPVEANSEAPAEEPAKAKIDYSSEAIKRESFAKISIENLDELVTLMKDPDAVIYKGQVASEGDLVKKIKTLNEENYCKVSFKGDVRKHDFFRLEVESLSSTPIDTVNVVNVFKANYKNTSGEVLLTCTHTTSNFFMQAAQMDFAKWITFYEFTGQKIETAEYKNPLTEERRVNALRILDMEKFKKVLLDENSKETFALLKGEVVDMADGYSAVANKKDTQSCIINDIAGTPTKELVYVRVAKGILEPTPDENPNANMYVTYRADAENFFIMSCFMAKSERWTKLMDTTQGVLEFGAMDRVTLLNKGA